MDPLQGGGRGGGGGAGRGRREFRPLFGGEELSTRGESRVRARGGAGGAAGGGPPAARGAGGPRQQAGAAAPERRHLAWGRAAGGAGRGGAGSTGLGVNRTGGAGRADLPAEPAAQARAQPGGSSGRFNPSKAPRAQMLGDAATEQRLRRGGMQGVRLGSRAPKRWDRSGEGEAQGTKRPRGEGAGQGVWALPRGGGPTHAEREKRARLQAQGLGGAGKLNGQARVLGGELWYPSCQSAARAKMRRGELPVEFKTLSHYVDTFEPLLLEEAREGVRRDAEEACARGRVSEVLSVEAFSGGSGSWSTVRLRLKSEAAGIFGNDVRSKECIQVLCNRRPPRHNFQGWMEREVSSGGGVCVGGTLQKVSIDPRFTEVEVRIHPSCSAYERRTENEKKSFFHAPKERQNGQASQCDCSKCLEALTSPKGGTWFLISCWTGLNSVMREHETLHRMSDFPLLHALLQPRTLIPKSCAEELDELPVECSGSAFRRHLASSFNDPQYEAILKAAAHTAEVTQTKSVSSYVKNARGRITLVQGPPGTGKTHTIWGMLNVLHMVHFQRYFHSLLPSKKPVRGAWSTRPQHGEPKRSRRRDAFQSILDRLQIGVELPTYDQSKKPRVLVCAPSNAAVDELLGRVMDRGFQDGGGNRYFPGLARMGSETANLTERARSVLVQSQATELVNLSQKVWNTRWKDLSSKISTTCSEIATIQHFLSAGAASDEDVTAEDKSTFAGQMTTLFEGLERLLVDMERLLQIEVKFSAPRDFKRERVRRELERSFLTEAELIFTTLGSSSRRTLAELGLNFEVVLIDEAVQSCETETLMPLVYGARHAILVGDPQQLPATVLSKLAIDMSYKRSLYERLQMCGSPTVMLTVQYRMHPAIREFPSSYFYDGKLSDAASVVQRPRRAFQAHIGLGAYRAFDLEGSREAFNPKNRSMANPDEADFVETLVLAMAKSSGRGGELPSLGIVTPYKAQRDLIRAKFWEKTQLHQLQCQGCLTSDVMVDTVDSFQGQEKDVIIFSSVRSRPAGGGGGHSFVADFRRVNVALTRAREALWLVTSRAALAPASPAWARLFEDVERRGLLIRVPRGGRAPPALAPGAR